MKITELQLFLTDHHVPYKTWGQRNCRSLFDLHDEIQNRESSLVVINGTATRVIRVASVLIYAFSFVPGMSGYRWYVLREDRHDFNDGFSVDRRGLPHSASEKIIGDESPEEAAHRALNEELGWTNRSQYKISMWQRTVGQKCVAEPSYEGLPTIVSDQFVWKCRIDDRLFDHKGYTMKVDGKTLHFHWELLVSPPCFTFPHSVRE